MSLPPAAELIEAVKTSGPAALDNYAPEIDALADVQAAAAYLKISRNSIYRERSRKRADGTPAWPAPDQTAARSAMWTYRTLILHRASMPGQGSAGRGRPRRAQP
jgi:hypothetical protein